MVGFAFCYIFFFFCERNNDKYTDLEFALNTKLPTLTCEREWYNKFTQHWCTERDISLLLSKTKKYMKLRKGKILWVQKCGQNLYYSYAYACSA